MAMICCESAWEMLCVCVCVYKVFVFILMYMIRFGLFLNDFFFVKLRTVKNKKHHSVFVYFLSELITAFKNISNVFIGSCSEMRPPYCPGSIPTSFPVFLGYTVDPPRPRPGWTFLKCPSDLLRNCNIYYIYL